jgi:hypothetical protein
MDDPMRDGWVKRNRALENIQNLDAACADFIRGEPKPYHVEVNFETDAGCHVSRFYELREPDPRLGAIVGDIAHDLRSALDVTAWQLAIRHDRKAAERHRQRVSFPLTKNSTDFRWHQAIPAFSEKALAVVEGLQPYESGDWEALRWLSILSNTDKHRLAIGCFSMVDLGDLTYHVEGDLPCTIEDLAKPGTEMVGGAEIARIVVQGPPQTKVSVEGEPTVQILFDGGPGRLGRAGIVAIFATVDQALMQLGGAFER